MDYLYTFLKFIVGGSVLVGVTYLADQVDPRYGGILAAAPIITTITFLFAYSESGRETTSQLVIATSWFMIPTFLFVLAFWFLMNRFGLIPSIGGAYGVWLGALLVVNRVVVGASPF